MLARDAWPSIADAPLALVPLGSTEQHGPHLPFSTDSIIAGAVAVAVAERLNDERTAAAIVAPVLPYGASGEHQSFPGTISIGHSALQHVLVELARSLSTWAGRIVIVNGHGGNVPSLATAVPQLIAEQHHVGWLPCAVPDGDAHAGRTETSLMLRLAPALVDLSAARPGNDTDVAELLPALRAGGTRSVSPNGVLGDPTGANRAEGEALLSSMVEAAARRIQGGRADARGCLADPAAGGPRS